MRLNADGTCNKAYIGKTGRRLGDRLREHIHFTRLPITWHRPSRWPPLYIPWSQNRRHVGIGDPFWLQKYNRKAQFWGQRDIQTPDTWTSLNAILEPECALQLYLLLKVRGACNVSLCKRYIARVFWVALKHWGRGSTLETSGFSYVFRTFSTHIFLNFVKINRSFALHSMYLPIFKTIYNNPQQIEFVRYLGAKVKQLIHQINFF